MNLILCLPDPTPALIDATDEDGPHDPLCADCSHHASDHEVESDNGYCLGRLPLEAATGMRLVEGQQCKCRRFLRC